MRTTVELPPALMRKAKARAAERGESLKTFLTRAVVHELGEADRHGGQRVRLPLFGDPHGPKVWLTSRDIERLLAGDDAARMAPRGRRRQ